MTAPRKQKGGTPKPGAAPKPSAEAKRYKPATDKPDETTIAQVEV